MTDGIRQDCLRAIGHHPQRAEIEASNSLVLDFVQAKPEAEIRRCRKGRAMAMDRPQPLLRPHEKRERRHDYEWSSVVEAAEPGADESHVMIERKPAYEDVGRARFHCFAHGPNIRQHITMTQHHALWVARAAGGVLQKGSALGLDFEPPASLALAQFVRADHGPQAFDLELEKTRYRRRFARGDQQHRLCVTKDPGLSLKVLL